MYSTDTARAVLTARSLPLFTTHGQNLHLLRSLPENEVKWTFLCPANMTSDGSDFTVPTKIFQHGNLVANADAPPLWQDSWVKHIPLIGKTIVTLMNFMRYDVPLESVAEFIASDLEDSESPWIGKAVGLIEGSK
jgi:hypothetical protein